MEAERITGADTLESDAQTFIDLCAERFWKPLPDGELTLFFVLCRSHNFGPRDHLHRLALAYALLVGHGENADVLYAARGKPIRRGEIVDPARIFVEAVTPADDPSPRKAQQRHSRDTRAIRHLQAQQIRPQSVVELGSKKGEGVHVWAGRQVARTSAGDRGKQRRDEAAGRPQDRALVRVSIGSGEPKDWWLYDKDHIDQVTALLKRLQHQRLFASSPPPR